MKHGIILVGGKGTRLQPFTYAINKSLLNIHGKAVVDYPLNTLKQLGVENVSIILGGDHFEQVVNYLQDGSRYEMNFHYVFQGEPKGISQAVNLCKNYVPPNTQFAVILGDNFYEKPLSFNNSSGAQIALYKHSELQRFGVASILNNEIVRIEEKPQLLNLTHENYAITGCYAFDSNFFDFFKESKPSARGEFEITDIIQHYNKIKSLNYTMVDGLWADAGTHQSINYINNYLRDA